MKIEKINENQIKFILNNNDLLDRNIKINELAYGSEKTQELFHEMMEQAVSEYGFEIENVPLMIEAIPIAMDSIIIVITKVSSHSSSVERPGLLPMMPPFSKQHKAKHCKPCVAATANTPNTESTTKVEKNSATENIFIFSFGSLEQVCAASKRLHGVFLGFSQLYKYQEQYILFCNDHSEPKENLDALLGEFGARCTANYISRYHLAEHGDLLIKENAAQVMATL